MSHEQPHHSELPALPIAEWVRLMESDTEIYQGKEPAIECMDGRTNGADGLAGSGILLERDPGNPNLPAKRYMDILRKRAEEGKLNTIYWHPDCGAAGLFLKQMGNANPTPEEINAAAEKFAKVLSTALGIPCKKVENEMGHHSERGIYVDGTERLNTKSEKLPNGFLLSPELTGSDWSYIIKEVEVAIGITFKGHGLGADSFSENNPYTVFLIRTPENSGYFGVFQSQIQTLISGKFPQFANKIAIKTVTPELK